MKKFIIWAILLLSVIIVPVKSFTLSMLVLAVMETFLLWCFRYTQRNVLLCFFILSLSFNWCFEIYIEQFYQYMTPYLTQFDLQNKLDYYACVALLRSVAVFFEILLVSLMLKFTMGLFLLIICINTLSVVIKPFLAQWLEQFLS